MEGPAAVSQLTHDQQARRQQAQSASGSLLYGETENELRGAVRSVLDDKSSWPAVRARIETAYTYDADLWHTLAAEVGCAGLLIGEEQGGAGASFREAAVVAEETGRALAPVPFLGSSVIATSALLAAGAGDLLGEIADGQLTATLAVPFASAWFSRAVTVRLDGPQPRDPAGTARLTGSVSGVADALPADLILIPADAVPFGLYAVRASEPGVGKNPLTSLDMTRQLCDLQFDRVRATLIAAGPAAEQALTGALLAGAGMLASEQLGLAERCLELTVSYVKERRQFARQVGSFQAIKHRLADLFVAVTQARAAARNAANVLASSTPGFETEAEIAVALAKSTCSDVSLKAAQEMVQLHGGIGFTWEHPAHQYLKRAKADSIALGTADGHRSALAGLVDLPQAGD
jgi:alkylation response protein AidB-like acyl-CoA dehydrogenase